MMNQTITKQNLEVALKKYKAENSIPNIYFFIGNYGRVYPYCLNFITVGKKEYELEYETIVTNDDIISELIHENKIYTDDVIIISIDLVTTRSVISPITYKVKVEHDVRYAVIKVEI